MIESVLIANRGEIALRIIRTCRRLGIHTVAVFTEHDAGSPHVLAADQAVPIRHYLDVNAIIVAAAEWGAIHPGYGFLSENAELARAAAREDVLFVGPTAEVMDQMGRKDAAREIAMAAGVPVVPSAEISTSSIDDGSPSGMTFPILVKAAAGGGGKGMRIVRSAEEYDEAVAAAKRESLHAFGDDTMLVEKYVERGRHIEVQVLGDTHGNVVHLFERDCSVQRRHQKVVEEAPAPTITPELRELVCTSAVALAAHVSYTGAGTVEFLLDEATGEAYFLEMNTRLQVEHPVTEAVVRVKGQPLDLVELQLRIADGEPLGFTQDDVTVVGHAIEARVYAEDPYAGFLPQAGTASIVRWPAGEGIRVDHALEPGQVVSTAFDPMLGKVIAHGPDRATARDRLERALAETAIMGFATNVGFLHDLVHGRFFGRAEIDTAWLDREPLEAPSRGFAEQIAAWSRVMVASMLAPVEPFQPDGWRLGGDPAPVVVELDRPVVVDRGRGLVDGEQFLELSAENHVLTFVAADCRFEATINATAAFVEVVLRGQRFLFTSPDRLEPTAVVGDGTLLSPMPGTVLEVRVVAGQLVEEGDVLGMMEAMKMELTLRAPFAGTVTEVDVAPGQLVALGARLFVVEPVEDPT